VAYDALARTKINIIYDAILFLFLGW